MKAPVRPTFWRGLTSRHVASYQTIVPATGIYYKQDGGQEQDRDNDYQCLNPRIGYKLECRHAIAGRVRVASAAVALVWWMAKATRDVVRALWYLI
jgi:hypothetical protein